MKWINQIDTIKVMGEDGLTISAIARVYGVTRQRMKQVVDRYIPNWNESYGSRPRQKKIHLDEWDEDMYDVARKKFRNKKASVLAKGVKWDLEFESVHWSSKCAVFGTVLNYFAETAQDNSVSIDCVDDELGYVDGNVNILSYKASKMKRNSSIEELEQMVSYLTQPISIGLDK